MKLNADVPILGDTPQQVVIRNDTKNGVLEGDERDRVHAGAYAEETHEIASQRKGGGLPAPVAGIHHGFRGTARNGI